MFRIRWKKVWHRKSRTDKLVAFAIETMEPTALMLRAWIPFLIAVLAR